jgi:hypothetical protein
MPHAWNGLTEHCLACGLSREQLESSPGVRLCSGRLEFREILTCGNGGPRWICEPIDNHTSAGNA